MSNLISKSARDLIGIDSPWRGMVWASLMLRAGNVHSDRVGTDPNYPYTNAVRIAGGRQVVLGGLQSFITIEATLPYSSPEALADAGDFLPFVGEYFEGSVPGYTGSACSTLNSLGYPYSGIGEGMPPDDVDVDSLEKYLVWCFLLGELELLNPTPNALLPISLDFLEEAPGGAALKLSAKLFIDYIGYRASDNLICSVIPPSVTPAVIPPPDPALEIQWADILNKPTFATVATSGSYANLTNRPTIPTKTSDLTNDTNFLTQVNYPVTSVNGLTGAVQITAAIGEAEWANVLNKPNFSTVATSGSYPDLINKPTIPTKTSDITNDSNFLTTAPVTSVNGQTGAVVLSLGSGGGGGGRITLTANRTYYIRPDGSDDNNGLTNTSGGAFLTFTKLRQVVLAIDGGGYEVTCQVADGTYNLSSQIDFTGFVGVSKFNLIGNTRTPNNVIIAGNYGYTAFTGLFKFGKGTKAKMDGFTVSNSGATNAFCLVIEGGYLDIYKVNFTGGGNSHISAVFGGFVELQDNYTITGNAIIHWNIDQYSILRAVNPGVTTLIGTPNFSFTFLYLAGSKVDWIPSGRTFSGSATGQQRIIDYYGWLNRYGISGTLPGNSSGSNSGVDI